MASPTHASGHCDDVVPASGALHAAAGVEGRHRCAEPRRTRSPGTPATAMVHCPYSFDGPKEILLSTGEDVDVSSDSSVGNADSRRASFSTSPLHCHEGRVSQSAYTQMQVARRPPLQPVHRPAQSHSRRPSAASPLLTPALHAYPHTPVSPPDALASPMYDRNGSPMYPCPPTFVPQWPSPPPPPPHTPLTPSMYHTMQQFETYNGVGMPGSGPNAAWQSRSHRIAPHALPRRESALHCDLSLAVPVDTGATSVTRSPKQPPETPINNPCCHSDSWKMVRIKRGMRRFRCTECGARWKTPCADAALHV